MKIRNDIKRGVEVKRRTRMAVLRFIAFIGNSLSVLSQSFNLKYSRGNRPLDLPFNALERIDQK